MLWHIELKFCIWLCFTVLQIKFECRQFASIFVGVMPLLELRILEIHSFPHFSRTCFDVLSWNFAYDFVLLYYRSSLSVVNFVGVMPLLELRILKIHNFLHFSLTCYIELKICIWLCLTILQIKFDCCQFASIFVGVMPLLERKMMKYTVFRTFLLHALTYELKFCISHCFTALQIKFKCRQFP